MKYIAAPILFLLSLNILGQTPDYFANDPKWRMDFWWDDMDLTCTNREDYVYYLDSTTTIGAHTYHVMKKRGEFYQTLIFGGPGDCQSNYTFDNDIAYLRQDGEKIFMNLSGQDTLMIDYGVSVGDTMRGYIFEQGGLTEDSTIHKIDTIMVNGEARRQFYISSPYSWADTIRIIEGIGYLYDQWNQHGEFIVNMNGVGISSNFGLYCYSQNDSTVWTYDNMASSCQYNVSVDDLESELQLSLFPNPVSSILSIEFESKEEIELLIVTDILGNIIKKHQINLNQGKAAIDLSTNSSGVYFLNVLSNGQLIGTRKIVLQK